MVEKASAWTLQLEKKRYFPLSIPCILQHRWFLYSLNLQRLAFQLGQIVCRGEPISLGKVLPPARVLGGGGTGYPRPGSQPGSRAAGAAPRQMSAGSSPRARLAGVMDKRVFIPFIATMQRKREKGRHYAPLKKKNQLHFEESCKTREKKTPKTNPPTISEAVPCCSLMTLSPPMAEKMYSCLSPQGCLQHSKWTCSV